LLYHRDDNGKIVEVQDDMVDAFHYALWGITHPGYDASSMQAPVGSAATYSFDKPVDPSRPGRLPSGMGGFDQGSIGNESVRVR
jgi:hypothetical protein